MSSGTGYSSYAFEQATQALQQQNRDLMRQGMSPRQRELTRRYQFARGRQYDGRGVTWAGFRSMPIDDLEAATLNGALPSGYLDPMGALEDVPYQLRKPDSRYTLVGLVVHRFTGLLFGEGISPEVKVPGKGNETTEEWIGGLVEAANFWQRWMEARDLGGAMGSVAVSFRFDRGRPMVEVHDPRWCEPQILDKTTGELASLDIRYMYEVAVPQPDGKPAKPTAFWYRRLIDQQRDIVFKPAPVAADGKEPIWAEDPEKTAAHGLGFCPARWVQNLPNGNEVDGEPDCDDGVRANVELMDQLMSHAAQGTSKNCDPTMHIGTDEEQLPALRKGSGNALKTETAGKVGYVEMTGSGIKTALEVRKELRAESLEMAECVLAAPDVAGKTATEIQRVYEAMFAKARRIRKQYAVCGIKPVLEDILRAARQLAAPVAQDGAATLGGQAVPAMVSHAVTLPPVVKDGSLVDRTLGEGTFVELAWPDFVSPTPIDAQAVATAAATAFQAKILSRKAAVAYIGPQFNVTDQAAELALILGDEAMAADALTADFLGQVNQPAPAPAEPPKGPLDDVSINDLTLGIQRLALAGDLPSLNMLRKVLAAKTGLPYAGDMTAEMLKATAEAATPDQPAGGPPPFGGAGG